MGAGAENCEGALRKNYCLLCEIDPTVRTGGKVQIVLSPFPAYYFRTAPLGRCVSTHESRRDSKANAAYPSRLVWWKSVKGQKCGLSVACSGYGADASKSRERPDWKRGSS